MLCLTSLKLYGSAVWYVHHNLVSDRGYKGAAQGLEAVRLPRKTPPLEFSI